MSQGVQMLQNAGDATQSCQVLYKWIWAVRDSLWSFREIKQKKCAPFRSYGGLRGAMVARLTPDQKAACSNHVGVTAGTFSYLALSPNQLQSLSDNLSFISI